MTDSKTKHRRGRTLVDKFDSLELAKQWLALSTGSVAWRWDGSCYPKTKRSQGPAVEALRLHAAPLPVLANLAPGGYPSFLHLRSAFTEMDKHVRLFTDDHVTGTVRSSRLDEIAVRWKLMMRHLVVLKRSGLSMH